MWIRNGTFSGEIKSKEEKIAKRAINDTYPATTHRVVIVFVRC